MAGARSFLLRSAKARQQRLWTLRLAYLCARTVSTSAVNWQLSQHGLGCAEAARGESERSSATGEGSLAAQKTERGNRAHFGRATRTARVPAAEQLENYLPQSY